MCRIGIVMGRPTFEIESWPTSEIDRWSRFHEEFAGLMTASECAGLVASTVANFSGKTKAQLEPEEMLLLAPSRVAEIAARKEAIKAMAEETKIRLLAEQARVDAIIATARKELEGSGP